MCYTGVRERLLSRNSRDMDAGSIMVALTQQVEAKDDKISKVIDRVLTQIFGKEAALLIYKHL